MLRFELAEPSFGQGCPAVSNPAKQIRLGGSVMPADDKNRLMAELTEAIRLEPHNATCLTRRAKCFRDLGEYEKALADANKAIRIDPRLHDAWVVRGLIRLHRLEYDPAVSDFNEAQAAERDLTEAIQLVPNNGYAYLARARANWRLNRPEHAVADFDKAITLLPKSPPYGYVARGQYYKCRGLLDLAIADFTQAIRLSPETGAFFMERGNAYFRQNDLSRAIEDFTEAIRLEPKNYMGYQSRARLFRTLGDNFNAQKDEDKVRELRIEKTRREDRASVPASEGTG